MPVAIEIKTADGLVGIVHAETPTEWPTLLALLEGDGSISKGMRRDVIEVCLWSRERISKGDRKHIDGVSRVYVGHTPLSEPVVLGNVVYVDTGIVYGRALTMISLAPAQPTHRDAPDAHMSGDIGRTVASRGFA